MDYSETFEDVHPVVGGQSAQFHSGEAPVKGGSKGSFLKPAAVSHGGAMVKPLKASKPTLLSQLKKTPNPPMSTMPNPKGNKVKIQNPKKTSKLKVKKL